MFRMMLIAGLALGLAACGGDDETAADEMMDDETMATADEHMDDVDDMDGMSDDEMMDDAAEMSDEVSLADLQGAFVDEYLQGEGTHPTRSGLMYRVLREGDGASPDGNDIVEVHYEGRLVDGTVFDSSYAREETIEFPLNGVIRGWTEGLQYMNVGSKYQFVIPPNLAYGDRGQGEDIPPGAVLVFDVELFNVTPVE